MGGCYSAPSSNLSDKSKSRRCLPSISSTDPGDDSGDSDAEHIDLTSPAPAISILRNPSPGDEFVRRYKLGKELGRGEFGITRRCTDVEMGETFACKTISKRRLKNSVDALDVRREVEIMRHMPNHQNIVQLRDAYEDGEAVHLVMELCEGGELFDRIVAKGHYTERAAANLAKTIIEIVQVVAERLPVSEPDAQMLMEAADVDGNGTIDCDEFVTVSVHLKKISSKEHLSEAFRYFDKDGSGFIEIDELREALGEGDHCPNDQVIREIISDVDVDKDGRISYPEFQMMMEAGIDWRNTSRQHSRAVYNTLSHRMFRIGSLDES